MNNFKTKNYEFVTFDKVLPKHVEAFMALENDPKVQEYFGVLTDFLDENFLLASKEGNIVGFISLYQNDRVEFIDWGLLSAYRGIRVNSEHTIGSQMVLEATNEIFKRNKLIDYFRADIRKDNIPSAILAERAGFTIHKKTSDGEAEYQKYRSGMSR